MNAGLLVVSVLEPRRNIKLILLEFDSSAPDRFDFIPCPLDQFIQPRIFMFIKAESSFSLGAISRYIAKGYGGDDGPNNESRL